MTENYAQKILTLKLEKELKELKETITLKRLSNLLYCYLNIGKKKFLTPVSTLKMKYKSGALVKCYLHICLYKLRFSVCLHVPHVSSELSLPEFINKALSLCSQKNRFLQKSEDPF
jgi:hypothetical protein